MSAKSLISARALLVLALWLIAAPALAFTHGLFASGAPVITPPSQWNGTATACNQTGGGATAANGSPCPTGGAQNGTFPLNATGATDAPTGYNGSGLIAASLVVDPNFTVTVGADVGNAYGIKEVDLWLEGQTLVLTQRGINAWTTSQGFNFRPQSAATQNGYATGCITIVANSGLTIVRCQEYDLQTAAGQTGFQTRPQYFGDPVNGSDSWDGSCAYNAITCNGGSSHGPFKHLLGHLTSGNSGYTTTVAACADITMAAGELDDESGSNGLNGVTGSASTCPIRVFSSAANCSLNNPANCWGLQHSDEILWNFPNLIISGVNQNYFYDSAGGNGLNGINSGVSPSSSPWSVAFVNSTIADPSGPWCGPPMQGCYNGAPYVFDGTLPAGFSITESSMIAAQTGASVKLNRNVKPWEFAAVGVQLGDYRLSFMSIWNSTPLAQYLLFKNAVAPFQQSSPTVPVGQNVVLSSSVVNSGNAYCAFTGASLCLRVVWNTAYINTSQWLQGSHDTCYQSGNYGPAYCAVNNVWEIAWTNAGSGNGFSGGRIPGSYNTGGANYGEIGTMNWSVTTYEQPTTGQYTTYIPTGASGITANLQDCINQGNGTTNSYAHCPQPGDTAAVLWSTHPNPIAFNQINSLPTAYGTDLFIQRMNANTSFATFLAQTCGACGLAGGLTLSTTGNAFTITGGPPGALCNGEVLSVHSYSGIDVPQSHVIKSLTNGSGTNSTPPDGTQNSCITNPTSGTFEAPFTAPTIPHTGTGMWSTSLSQGGTYGGSQTFRIVFPASFFSKNSAGYVAAGFQTDSTDATSSFTISAGSLCHQAQSGDPGYPNAYACHEATPVALTFAGSAGMTCGPGADLTCMSDPIAFSITAASDVIVESVDISATTGTAGGKLASAGTTGIWIACGTSAASSNPTLSGSPATSCPNGNTPVNDATYTFFANTMFTQANAPGTAPTSVNLSGAAFYYLQSFNNFTMQNSAINFLSSSNGMQQTAGLVNWIFNHVTIIGTNQWSFHDVDTSSPSGAVGYFVRDSIMQGYATGGTTGFSSLGTFNPAGGTQNNYFTVPGPGTGWVFDSNDMSQNIGPIFGTNASVQAPTYANNALGPSWDFTPRTSGGSPCTYPWTTQPCSLTLMAIGNLTNGDPSSLGFDMDNNPTGLLGTTPQLRHPLVGALTPP